ncbi:hypothetical protein Poly30_40080 [Planctomycetes bacterium Poly30]|uniref:Right handed beta helix domain-containing protein n=1 Tax=Saltatorellus ferox TaxID=2528018 RepID=A0A518EWN4_9BACT|nr:hypothetical protein Poly30_40080 [Planctomycetes bacterium Poly30]
MGLDVDEVVTLRGLHLHGTGAADVPVFRVDSCQGSVHVQDCDITQDRGADGLASAQVFGSLDVRFANCEITGGVGSDVTSTVFEAGETALSTIASRVTLDGCKVIGGAAGGTVAYTSITDTPPGGAAVRLFSRSVAWVEGSELTGGRGFELNCHSGCGVLEGGDGGPGVRVQPGSILMRLDSIMQGGEGGIPYAAGTNVPGADGPPLIGVEHLFPGRLRSLEGPDIVRTESDPALGTVVPVRLTGVPGETVTAWASEQAGFRALGSAGILGLRGFDAALTFDLGVVPSTGILETSLVLPAEPAGVARTYGIQSGFRTGPNGLRLSRVHAVTTHGGGVLAPTSGDVVHVAADAAPGGDGSSWAMAASSLADVLAVLPLSTGESPVTVWVKAGAYSPAPPGGDADATFPIGTGWRILGGFSGSEASESERNPLTHVTVLDGDLNGNDLPNFGGFSDNSAQVLQGAAYEIDSFLMDGFTIRGANGSGALEVRGHARFSRCVFKDNLGMGLSPSVALYSSTSSGDVDVLTFQDCVFADNRSAQKSAIVAEQFRNRLELHGCLFARNTKTMYFGPSRAVAVTAEGSSQCDTEILDCTFADNRLLANVTFQSCVTVGARTTVANCIFWNNTIPSGEVLDLRVESTFGITIERNRLTFDQPGWSMNTSADPRFVGAGDYRLAADSPLLDAGDNTFVPAGLTQDLDGDFRIKDDAGAPNVGVGQSRIVDLGAFER